MQRATLEVNLNTHLLYNSTWKNVVILNME